MVCYLVCYLAEENYRWSLSGTLSITGQFSSLRVGESLRIGMLSSPSTSGKTYEDPCPIQTRRDKRIESESHAWARIGKNIGSSYVRESFPWTSKYLPVAKYLSDVQGYVAHSHGRPRNLSAVGIFSSLKFYISSSHQIPIKFKMKEKSRTAIFFHNLIGSEKKK